MSESTFDQRRGHFVVETERGRVVGADLGPILWLDLDPEVTRDEARSLAAALTWWADRESSADATLEGGSSEDFEQRINYAHDLFAFINEGSK